MYLKFSIIYGDRQLDVAFLKIDKYEKLLQRKTDSIVKKIKYDAV